MDYRPAQPTIRVQEYRAEGIDVPRFRATATWPMGLWGTRRPVSGPERSSTADAVAALLALPKLAAVIVDIVTPKTYPGDD